MPKTVLVADDSLTIRKVVGMLLATEDVTLTAVDNGLDAISRARELRPDLVLADCTMPGKSGYEVCEAIKNDPNLARTTVLLLAGSFEPFDPQRAQLARADGHLVKPFDSASFLERVKGLVGLAGGSGAPIGHGSVSTGIHPSLPGGAPAPRPPMAAAPTATSPGIPRAPGRPIPTGTQPAVQLPRPPGQGMPGQGLPPGTQSGMRHTLPPAPGMPMPGGPGLPRPPGPGMPPPQPGMQPGMRPPGPGMPMGGPNLGQGLRPMPGQGMPNPAMQRPPGMPPQHLGPPPGFRPPPGPPPPGAMGGPPPGSMGGPPPRRDPYGLGGPPRPGQGPTAPQPPLRNDGGEARLREALSAASREVVEKIAWEVVPQLAETIIREELERLIKDREAKGLS
jgi:CheY-like chemotaxis protein